MVDADTVRSRILAAIPDATVEIEDLTGTKDHYRARIVSKSFTGLSRVEQHQAVYRALGELMAGPVHALALETRSE